MGIRDPSDYIWSTYISGHQVQFGIPETDERWLWLICDDHGNLTLGGPAGQLENDIRIAVSFSFGATHESEEDAGQTEERGDGTNFSVAVTPDSPVLKALLKDDAVTVSIGGRRWMVPGKGAGAEIRPLVSACTSGRK